jgi:hypothetical protein
MSIIIVNSIDKPGSLAGSGAYSCASWSSRVPACVTQRHVASESESFPRVIHACGWDGQYASCWSMHLPALSFVILKSQAGSDHDDDDKNHGCH